MKVKVTIILEDDSTVQDLEEQGLTEKYVLLQAKQQFETLIDKAIIEGVTYKVTTEKVEDDHA